MPLIGNTKPININFSALDLNSVLIWRMAGYRLLQLSYENLRVLTWIPYFPLTHHVNGCMSLPWCPSCHYKSLFVLTWVPSFPFPHHVNGCWFSREGECIAGECGSEVNGDDDEVRRLRRRQSCGGGGGGLHSGQGSRNVHLGCLVKWYLENFVNYRKV